MDVLQVTQVVCRFGYWLLVHKEIFNIAHFEIKKMCVNYTALEHVQKPLLQLMTEGIPDTGISIGTKLVQRLKNVPTSFS